LTFLLGAATSWHAVARHPMQEFSRRGPAETTGKTSSIRTPTALRWLDWAGRLWGSDHELSVEPTRLAGTREATRRCLEQTACLWNPSRWLAVDPEKAAASTEATWWCPRNLHQLLTSTRHLMSLESSRQVLVTVRQLPGARWLPSGQMLEFVLLKTLLVGAFFATHGIAYLPDAGLTTKDSQLWALQVISPLTTAISFCFVAPDVLASIRTNNPALFLPLFHYGLAVCTVLGIALGIHVSNVTVIAMNMFGFSSQILCLLVEHYVRVPSGRLVCFSIKQSLGWIAILYMTAAPGFITFIGPAIAVSNTIVSGFPMIYLGPTLRNREFSNWVMFCVSYNFCVNLCWSVWGIMIQDMALLVPSVVAMEVCVIRIAVGLWCWGRLPFDMTFLLRVYSLGSGAHKMASVKVPAVPYGKMIELEEI